jgi:hypothetical protein
MPKISELIGVSSLEAADAFLLTKASPTESRKIAFADLRRSIFAPPVLASQSDWYIDAVAGNDANDGLTSGTAIRTAAELRRRMPPGSRLRPPVNLAAFSRLVTIHAMTSLPVDDPLDLDFVQSQDVNLVLVGGVDSTLRTGTFTSVTPKNPATNQGWEFADSTLPTANWWADHLGDRVRITSGPRAGTIFWVGKDLGARRMRGSDPSIPDAFGPEGDAYTYRTLVQQSPQVGDAYAVEKLRDVTIGYVNIRAESTSDFAQFYQPIVVFMNLAMNVRTEAWAPHFGGPEAITIAFVGCRQGALSVGGVDVYSINDCVAGNTIGGAGSLGVRGGVYRRSGGLVTRGATNHTLIRCFPGGRLFLDYDTQLESGQLQGHNVWVNSCSVWDTPVSNTTPGGHAVYVGAEATGFVSPPMSSIPGAGFSVGRITDDVQVRLWGAGAAGAGVHVGAGCTFLCTAGSLPTITGTGGEHFQLAGASTARSWDEANGAYTSARACTWPNLAATIAGGGLAGNAHNLSKRASIVSL